MLDAVWMVKHSNRDMVSGRKERRSLRLEGSMSEA
jgi:hypothetical protein